MSVRKTPLVLAAALVAAGVACTAAPGGPRPIRLSPCGRAFVLVDRGRPAATIIIPETAGEPEQRAAEILRTSILKMSGVDLPVRTAADPGGPAVAAIGFPPEALPKTVAPSLRAMRVDGFVAATSTGNLYVCGGGGRGVVYGVVHILEKYFGCRRFSPTVEVFPKRDDIYLGCVLEVGNPGNDVRIVHGEFALDPDYRDWMRLHDHGALYGDGYYVHTFQRLLPWQTYFEAHPEYFALVSGARSADRNAKPCYSNPEVIEKGIERAMKYFEAKRRTAATGSRGPGFGNRTAGDEVTG
jgi:hypothetical protein